MSPVGVLVVPFMSLWGSDVFPSPIRHMPGHTSREVLIILSSLTTCDPANIYDLIQVRKFWFWVDLAAGFSQTSGTLK